MAESLWLAKLQLFFSLAIIRRGSLSPVTGTLSALILFALLSCTPHAFCHPSTHTPTTLARAPAHPVILMTSHVPLASPQAYYHPVNMCAWVSGRSTTGQTRLRLMAENLRSFTAWISPLQAWMSDSLWDPFLVVPMYVLLPPHGMHLHLLIGTDLDRNFGERDGRDRRERDLAHVQCATMVVRSVASIAAATLAFANSSLVRLCLSGKGEPATRRIRRPAVKVCTIPMGREDMPHISPATLSRVVALPH